MNKFLKENKVFLAIIVGALIVGAALYFGLNKDEGGKESSSSQVECSAPSKVIVTKVIDGDTVVVEGGYHIRLLGIDADESSYPCYDVAKSRLEELILNKKVRLEKDVTDVDQYDRCLRYVFLDDQNIDLQLINEGLVIARFYPPDLKYQNEITEAEKTAIDGKVGCKWSGAAANSVNTENKIVFQWEKLTSELTSLNIIDACQAGNYYGKEMIIEGKVADTYHD